MLFVSRRTSLDDHHRAEILSRGLVIIHRDVGALTPIAESRYFASGRPGTSPADHHLKRVCVAALAEVGVTVGDSMWDRPQVRRVGGRFGPGLGAHRDTWVTGRMEQVNWWVPVSGVDSGHSLRVWPQFWTSDVAIGPSDWAGVGQLPSIEPPNARATTVVVGAGDMVCFSGAQLHSSRHDRLDQIRTSIEFRTFPHHFQCEPPDHPSEFQRPSHIDIGPIPGASS